jgi:hypothetical protein
MRRGRGELWKKSDLGGDCGLKIGSVEIIKKLSGPEVVIKNNCQIGWWEFCRKIREIHAFSDGVILPPYWQ